MRRMWVVVAVVTAAAIAAAVGLTRYAHARVEVVHPVRGPAVEAVYAAGTVEPTVMVPIGPRTAARLAALLVDEGNVVAKGQLLARFEDEDLIQAVAQAEAEASIARQDADRVGALALARVVSQATADQAASTLASANARLASARATLDYLQLRSPGDGRILRRDGEIGQLIPANQPVFWLTTGPELRVAAEVDEEDIALVAIGQCALLSADAFPGRSFAGVVSGITPKGDPISRSYRVRIAVAGESPLVVGMTAEANIIVREEEAALLIPASAIKDGAVWVVRAGKVERLSVAVGARAKDAVEIRSGIGGDDLVVRDALRAPAEGAAPRVQMSPWTPR